MPDFTFAGNRCEASPAGVPQTAVPTPSSWAGVPRDHVTEEHRCLCPRPVRLPLGAAYDRAVGKQLVNLCLHQSHQRVLGGCQGPLCGKTDGTSPPPPSRRGITSARTVRVSSLLVRMPITDLQVILGWAFPGGAFLLLTGSVQYCRLE